MIMSLADILVHIDNSPSMPERLNSAILLAKKHAARVTGLYVITHQYYQPRSTGIEEMSTDARKLFDLKTRAAGVDARWLCADWSVVGVGSTEIICHHAHYTDLVVAGQFDPDSDEGKSVADLPERLISSAGRPVLVIPSSGSYENIGKKILVAWKAGRESTRAVNDAMPLLKRAEKVTLLAINSSDCYDDDESICSSIAEHLGRHGINAEVESIPALHTSVGDALLNRTFEEGYDLLVMGAFAHTPQGTLSLGTVARQMLRQMTVPVLFSH